MRGSGKEYNWFKGKNKITSTNVYEVKECWNGLRVETQVVCGWGKSVEPFTWQDRNCMWTVKFHIQLECDKVEGCAIDNSLFSLFFLSTYYSKQVLWIMSGS